MSKVTYKNIVRRKCKERAFECLMSKRGRKGENMKYKNLRNTFDVRNLMTNIPSNYISKKANASRCIRGKIEDIEHIFIWVDIPSRDKNLHKTCFLRYQNPTWNTWDKNFECGTAQPRKKSECGMAQTSSCIAGFNVLNEQYVRTTARNHALVY